MIEKLLEFVVNHSVLVAVWAAFILALLWDNHRRSGRAVNTAQAIRLMNQENAVVVDIRDHNEFSQGHITNALNIPLAALDERLTELDKHKSVPIVLVCKTGQSVSVASRKLLEKGFDAVRLTGGMAEWTGQSLPVVKH